MKKKTKEDRLNELESIMKELKTLDPKYNKLELKNSKTEKEWKLYHELKDRIYELDRRGDYLETQIRKLERKRNEV